MISFTLSNKVALVTGSSRGLGYGIAKSLGKAGAKVVINYLNDRESGENALENLRNEGIHSMLVRADVSDPEQIKSLVEAVEEKFGSLDILVPNATPDQPQNQSNSMMLNFTGKCMIFLSLVLFIWPKLYYPG